MANTNESAASNLLGNITGPLQRVADKLALTMKASKALHGGILGSIGRADAAAPILSLAVLVLAAASALLGLMPPLPTGAKNSPAPVAGEGMK